VTPRLKLILIVAGLMGVFTIAAVYTPEQQFGLVNDKQCELNASLTCTFYMDDQQVIVKFVGKAQVEELNQVNITLPKDAKLDFAWVQGVNMFMGKIPLSKLPSENARSKAEQAYEFFIGSCSEAHMRWQLILTVTSAEHKSKRLFVNFATEKIF
jgi:hypothetical protein